MSALELRVPPALVALAVALMMGVTAAIWPGRLLHFPGRTAVAAAIALAGAILTAAGVREFRRARTSVNPLRPEATSALVISGVYRLTRNPMYLGFAALLAAWALWLASAPALAGVIPFVLYMNRFQIVPEERAMRALFPGDFQEYSRTVRRWI